MIEAQAAHLREHNANVHRGVYELAQQADAAFEGARRADRRLHRRDPQTHDLHQERHRGDQPRRLRLGPRNVGPGDAVLVTQMEHHANLVPWQVLCRERGAELSYLEVDDHGELSLEALDDELARGDVRMVAFAHVSNVLGTINPVAEIARRAREAGAVTLVDGAQAVPQMPVDVQRPGA